MAIQPGKGGFVRPISLSLFIRDYLADGRETWALDIYQAYKQAAEAIPLARGRGKRHVISYSGFRTYIWVMRRLGLIEYVTNPDGSTKTGPPVDRAGTYAPYLAETIFLRAVPSRLGDASWTNIWKGY